MTTRPAAHRWTCTSCLLEIHHQPTFHVGLAFCCAGCVADGPCVCSYDLETDMAGPAGEPRLRELVAVD
jgi:hypothetical protein